MVFVKVVKNKSYFKRFQVKYRRRREGKTDYRARLRLTIQDKDKYNAPKYRLVVRQTNTDIVCQITAAKIAGDVVLCAAYAHELTRYGIKLGHTNYAAAYATGLLLARRLLAKLGLDKKYEGVKKADGKEFLVEEPEEGARPFKALLDVGLARTTTGAKVFGAMKGAVDGGLYIPHSNKRFPGYDKETKNFKADVLRNYIFGGHVANYMKKLESEEPEKYKKQFSRFIKEGIKHSDVAKIYEQAHAAIRADPSFKATEKKTGKFPRYGLAKITLKERRKRVAAKKQKLLAAQ